MLEGLDKIEWTKVQHAYGPAGDVPDLLRRLSSRDRTTSDAAIGELYGNIWHQGTVYEATAHAVPFLIELAAGPQSGSRAEILVFLASIANGNSYLDVHQHLDLFKNIYGGEMQTEKWKSDLARELSWVKAARDAVLAGMDRYIAMLGDSDWPVREAAAFLLASLGGDASGASAAIENAFAIEREPRVKVSFLLALGVLEQNVWRAIEDGSADASSGVRLAAALSKMRLLREKAPDAAIEVLFEALEQPKDFEEAFEGSPWIGDDLESFVTGYLTFLGRARSVEVARNVIDALKRAEGWTAKRIAQALLAIVFDVSDTRDQPRERAHLSDIQREALAAVCKSKGAWKSRFDMAATLRALGLPEERAKLEKLL